ncbi:MAG: RNA polymerase sigma-70 factor (ECF subfamily) [Crocinitomicaceae bacterium]|jgi:RNA polymerase sigma-70 factor (ECF subfamily)
MSTCTSYNMKDNKQQYTEQFMEYYEKYSDDIFRFCMVKTRNRSLSLDITQETFMKFWEYIIKGTDIKNERPLLYRIAKNLVIDSYRKKKDILVEDFTAGSYNDYLHDNQQERMENKIDGEKAITLLHKLPESIREIINLRFIHDFSINEIATTVGMNPKTVSVYLHRGLKKLKEILENYEK